MILLGNTFPLSLIRRRAVITPATLEELRTRLQTEGYATYWGHANTWPAAASILGTTTHTPPARQALTLSGDSLPMLDGQVFDQVWVLSPDLTPGFRPAIGQEVPASHITGWQVLHIRFPASLDCTASESPHLAP